jgi:hypothetical protein
MKSIRYWPNVLRQVLVLYIQNIISKEDLIYQDELQSNLHYEVSFGTKKKWLYKTGDLLKEVKFTWNFLWQDKKMWPFNTSDCLIEVTSLTGLTLFISVSNYGIHYFSSMTQTFLYITIYKYIIFSLFTINIH